MSYPQIKVIHKEKKSPKKRKLLLLRVSKASVTFINESLRRVEPTQLDAVKLFQFLFCSS